MCIIYKALLWIYSLLLSLHLVDCTFPLCCNIISDLPGLKCNLLGCFFHCCNHTLFNHFETLIYSSLSSATLMDDPCSKFVHSTFLTKGTQQDTFPSDWQWLIQTFALHSAHSEQCIQHNPTWHVFICVSSICSLYLISSYKIGCETSWPFFFFPPTRLL